MRAAEKIDGFIFFIALLLYSFSLAVSSSSDGHLSSKVGSLRFWISNDTFWKDGHPFQIIGGDLHYFRVLPEYWEDRLLRARALGLNTIQTYVPWNLHEPQPGNWNFHGIADLEYFLKTSKDLGFLIMLRIGPYICAEWDLGGFPPWILAIEPKIRLRSSDHAFLLLVERWWNILLPKVVPFLYENGGPIIMVQIENEFGSYGNDQAYLHHLVALARRHLSYKTILYTTDGGYLPNLESGTVHGEGVFAAVDFSTGEDAWSIFQRQKMFNAPGKSPSLSSEFYTGWLTHWGEQIAETDADFTAHELEKIISQNGSVVLYMAHGGTNFGFYNGANSAQNASDYHADLTSYDYDAPIRESGDVDNSKFKAMRKVIKKFQKTPLPPVPSNNRRTRYGHVKVNQVATLFDVLDSVHDHVGLIQSEHPLPMESVGQMFGFLLYTSEYPAKESDSTLSIVEVHDRGQVFVACQSGGELQYPRYVGELNRWSNREIKIPWMPCANNISLYVLVENMGRLNYGPFLYDRKGILSYVMLDGVILHKWKMFPVPFSNLGDLLPTNPLMQFGDFRVDHLFPRIPFAHQHGIPAYYKGSFTIDRTKRINDTYLSLRGWNKGVVFVNNFNVGRFWPQVGPQCNLYIPAPILQHGQNVVVLFELHAPNPSLMVEFVENPDFSCGIKFHPSSWKGMYMFVRSRNPRP